MQAPFRRIVTGHNAEGKAIIQEDGPPPRVQRIGGLPIADLRMRNVSRSST